MKTPIFARTKFARRKKNKGFALVVTISLMVLLSLLAVAMLGLSAVSIRGGNHGNQAAIAKANARLAMILALGQLQKTLGRDQGVSASASAVLDNPSNPRLTGAWKGWHWEPASSGGPSYSEKSGTFAGWLVSASDVKSQGSLAYARTSRTAGTDAVNVVAAGVDSQGDSTGVVVEKVRLDAAAGGGKMAWAVFDESTKAAIQLPGRSTLPRGGMEIVTRNAPDRVRADALDGTLVSLKTPKNFISLSTAEISAEASGREQIRRRFHDFTTDSMGLITDTAHGGLKRDLSQWFSEATLPTGAFAQVSPYASAFAAQASAPRWAYIHSHYRKFANATGSGAEAAYNLDSRLAASTDFAINRTGNDASPTTARMLPVVAKLQLIFSMVGHTPFNVDAPISRRQFLDTSGDPRGHQNYAAINLAYDPIVTLYNPYDVTLDLSKIRIRIWDPPVGFRFRKIDNRTGVVSEFRSGGQFDGLAQFQIANESNAKARKCFTLVLSDGSSEALTGDLKLRPGEVRVFSPRIENSWTWGLETQGGYSSNTQATFFDWNADRNFGNRDNRRTARFGAFGIECAPGWDPRAGLQTDHLSLASGRPLSSLYSFEQSRPVGFVTIRLTDEVEVDSKPIVKAADSRIDFQVDILAGNREGDSSSNIAGDTNNRGVSADTLRSFRFNFADKDITDEVSADPNYATITRRFMGSDLMQADNDRTVGGKKPFAMLELSARATRDPLNDGKPWLFNNMVVEGAQQDTSRFGLSHQSYDLRYTEISSFNNFPDGVSVDPDTKRGYFGAGGSVAEGSPFVHMYHLPLTPAASMGDLVHANLVAGAELPRVVHPLGNSRAHPLIPANAVFRPGTSSQLLDHTYLLNEAMWDSYFFSSLVDGSAGGSGVTGDSRTLRDLVEDIIQGGDPALNARIKPLPSSESMDELAAEFSRKNALARGQETAKYFGIDGPFNVNSTSVDAWRAVLSSLRDRVIEGMSVNTTGAVSPRNFGEDGETPFARANRPMGDGSDGPQSRWAGFRSLNDRQIESLAKAIVEQIELRGRTDGAPSMSLGEFVNRRIGSAGDLHVLSGLLQTAIDNTDINTQAHRDASKPVDGATISASRKLGVANEAAMRGQSGEGSPPILSQGDLMSVLAPVATVRGDTFKIRAYGEATSADGRSVLARAWCEAVVQRLPEYVDPADDATTVPSDLRPVNNLFGRRFSIVSFRWLDEDEILAN
ncbi:MAG: hypothetical protein MUF31_12545 [Akkermansiaceae bacterium]|jgi:hypothetical protein|nr:hypothetical protein [Akkermansiaceae bacterium]